MRTGFCMTTPKGNRDWRRWLLDFTPFCFHSAYTQRHGTWLISTESSQHEEFGYCVKYIKYIGKVFICVKENTTCGCSEHVRTVFELSRRVSVHLCTEINA